MKKILILAALSLAFVAQGADTQTETQHYIEVIRTNIFKQYKGMFKQAKGLLKHPFITPGNSSYQDQLWDWDSWLTDIALRQILLENGSTDDKKEAIQYEQGCILNFLDVGNSGYIPVVISPNNRSMFFSETNFIPWEHNMHKPCLAQHAAFLVKINGGDAEWLRNQFPKMQAFVNCYHNHFFNKDAGLYYWQTDEFLGVDNDPSTFFRPHASSGSILLNCFMYKERGAGGGRAGGRGRGGGGGSGRGGAEGRRRARRE